MEQICEENPPSLVGNASHEPATVEYELAHTRIVSYRRGIAVEYELERKELRWQSTGEKVYFWQSAYLPSEATQEILTALRAFSS